MLQTQFLLTCCALAPNSGFVVSRRLRRPSFADSYYGVYVNDLPLFVTVDSVLHAFHSSFDRGLMEMEEQVLLPLLTSAIDAMAKQLGTMHAQACNPRTTTTTSELQCEAFVDMDAYLAVARSLLHGKPVAASSKEVRASAVAHGVWQRGILTLIGCLHRVKSLQTNGAKPLKVAL